MERMERDQEIDLCIQVINYVCFEKEQLGVSECRKSLTSIFDEDVIDESLSRIIDERR